MPIWACCDLCPACPEGTSLVSPSHKEFACSSPAPSERPQLSRALSGGLCLILSPLWPSKPALTDYRGLNLFGSHLSSLEGNS